MVFDHAAAQRTDGRLAHRSAPGLDVRLLIPSSSSQGTSDSVNRACSCRNAVGVVPAGYCVSGFVPWRTREKYSALEQSVRYVRYFCRASWCLIVKLGARG